MKVLTAAYQGAEKILERTMQGILDDDLATDEDQLKVYEKLRGNPQAISMYAVRFAPEGSNPMVEARRYEKEMERKWKSKHGKGG